MAKRKYAKKMTDKEFAQKLSRKAALLEKSKQMRLERNAASRR